jgi:uncharacterized protein YwgA
MVDENKACHYVKLLLYTAKKNNVKVTATMYQKIIYLLSKEKELNLDLDFMPSFFGVHSFKLQECVEKLIELGEIKVIEEDEVRDPISGLVIAIKRYYVLNTDFKPNEDDKEFEEFFSKWLTKSRSEILKYVYEKYPEDNKYIYVRDRILS